MTRATPGASALDFLRSFGRLCSTGRIGADEKLLGDLLVIENLILIASPQKRVLTGKWRGLKLKWLGTTIPDIIAQAAQILSVYFSQQSWGFGASGQAVNGSDCMLRKGKRIFFSLEFSGTINLRPSSSSPGNGTKCARNVWDVPNLVPSLLSYTSLAPLQMFHSIFTPLLLFRNLTIPVFFRETSLTPIQFIYSNQPSQCIILLPLATNSIIIIKKWTAIIWQNYLIS